jgi:WD40 repeat protein
MLNPLVGHTGGVYALAVGERQGQKVIVSGSGDNSVRIWDSELLHLLQMIYVGARFVVWHSCRHQPLSWERRWD